MEAYNRGKKKKKKSSKSNSYMIREMLTSQRNEELEEAISNRFVISERFGMSQSVKRIIKASRAVDGKYTKRFGEGAAGYKTGNPNLIGLKPPADGTFSCAVKKKNA